MTFLGGLLNPNFMRRIKKSNEAILRKRCLRRTKGGTVRAEVIALNKIKLTGVLELPLKDYVDTETPDRINSIHVLQSFRKNICFNISLWISS